MKIFKHPFFTSLAYLVSILFIAILGYKVSLQFVFLKNLNHRDLCETTQSLLAHFHEPVDIRLVSNDIELTQQIKILIQRYQQKQPLIKLQIEKARLHQPPLPHHALIISHQDCQHILDLSTMTLNENHLTQALFKVQRKPNQWLVFLQGHAEPSLYGTQNTDYSLFRQSLENQGFKVQQLNLATTPFIPDNTSVLIINSVKTNLLPKEQSLIEDYIAKGNSLLWLMSPSSHPLPSLSHTLGVFAHAGTIVDAHGQHLGTPHPAITIIENYPTLPFQAPKALTAFPFSVALDLLHHPDFQSEPLLMTHKATWTETAHLSEEISFNPEKNEISGPLLLGVNLTRRLAHGEQRITVIGNSHFLSNGTIENYGNLALGLNLINWLNHDDALLHIEQPVANEVSHIPFLSALLIQYVYPSLSVVLVIFSIAFFLYRHQKSHKISAQTF